jgi:hypothetical protein
MTEAACGLSPPIRRNPDFVTDLCARLDQLRRTLRRQGYTQFARDMGDALRLLRDWRMIEESWGGQR